VASAPVEIQKCGIKDELLMMVASEARMAKAFGYKQAQTLAFQNGTVTLCHFLPFVVCVSRLAISPNRIPMYSRFKSSLIFLTPNMQ
jgi:hypothetical protein